MNIWQEMARRHDELPDETKQRLASEALWQRTDRPPRLVATCRRDELTKELEYEEADWEDSP